MEKLTESKIKKFQYRPGFSLDIRFDSEVRGFGVRIYKTQVKSYIIKFREHGKSKLLTLGSAAEFSLEDARNEARRLLSVHSANTVPLARALPLTFVQISTEFLEYYAKQHRRTWAEDERRLKKHILPAIGAIPIETLSTIALVRLHADITRQGPIEANRCIELVRTIWNRAKEWGHVTGDNPADAVQRNKEQKRKRWLSPEEMALLFSSLQQEKNLYIRAVILLYLLTGARKSELLHAQWKDYNRKARMLIVEQTKTGLPYVFPLSHYAVELVESLPRKAGNPYLFPGHRAGSHLVNIRKPWAAVCSRAGLRDVHIHDLRHTVGSWLAMQGESLLVIGHVLHHNSARSTERYAHMADEPTRDALERLACRIEALHTAADIG